MEAIDLVIVGAGPAGLFAAFQAGMLGLSTEIIESLELVGGQCSNLYPEKPIYDIPAYPIILAEDLIEKLLEQIKPFKQKIHLEEEVLSLNDQKDHIEIITNKRIVLAKAVILATGGGKLLPNKPPLAGLEAFENQSVFYKITNKNLFANKRIVIAGGGDSAIDWAITLAQIAEKVFIIHRRDKFRAMEASMTTIEALVKAGQLEVVTPYQLIGVEGEAGQLKAVQIQKPQGDLERINCDFLLPFFGIAFDHSFLNKTSLDRTTDGKKILVSSDKMQTNNSRIFAIGDISYYPGKLNLILTGFAEAALAVHGAFSAAYPDKSLHLEHSTTKGLPTL